MCGFFYEKVLIAYLFSYTRKYDDKGSKYRKKYGKYGYQAGISGDGSSICIAIHRRSAIVSESVEKSLHFSLKRSTEMSRNVRPSDNITHWKFTIHNLYSF